MIDTGTRQWQLYLPGEPSQPVTIIDRALRAWYRRFRL